MVELDSLKDSISATPMREAYYRGEIQTEFFPVGTIQFLDEFKKHGLINNCNNVLKRMTALT